MISLNFNAKEAYQGSYSYNGIEYDAYTVTYCSNPIIGQNWLGLKSEDFFKMNIKVKKGLSNEQLKNAQILMYNPWGGDYGHPASRLEELDNEMKIAVIQDGWVLVEPGMRGNNAFTGTAGKEDYYDYGKIPWPLVDLKAAIRYLRYENNVTDIPGNKDRIWIAGTSSGGCASTIIGTSGDSPIFDSFLKEIGAANTSDAVYGSAPSCPVMNRANGDPALAWERWDSYENTYNKALAQYFEQYFNSLHLKAEMDVNSIQKGDELTTSNVKEYLYAYVKKAGLKFFNKLSKEEIESYLSQRKKPDLMYGTPDTSRDWIQPVFNEEGKVIDFKGTYDEFWHYVVGDTMYDKKNEINWQYEKTITAPDEMFLGNGIVSIDVGEGFMAKWACPSSFSFGKPNDYAAVFSSFGQQWIMEKRNMTINEEYQSLIELQRNCVNPMYFMDTKQSKVASKWFMRTGTVDLVTPHPIFIGLGTYLMNEGKDVDIAFVWDQVHGLTSEIKEFIEYADKQK